MALEGAWMAMVERARDAITRLADDHPAIPIGVAFVDAAREPGWIGRDPSLRPHPPSLRGCFPTVAPGTAVP